MLSYKTVTHTHIQIVQELESLTSLPRMSLIHITTWKMCKCSRRQNNPLIFWCFPKMNSQYNKTINCGTFQDRRPGESSKPALVRQEPVKDTEKSAEVATNRGESWWLSSLGFFHYSFPSYFHLKWKTTVNLQSRGKTNAGSSMMSHQLTHCTSQLILSVCLKNQIFLLWWSWCIPRELTGV